MFDVCKKNRCAGRIIRFYDGELMFSFPSKESIPWDERQKIFVVLGRAKRPIVLTHPFGTSLRSRLTS